MAERKVLNKYYPPDFDPSKIKRTKRAKDFQEKVRLMTPFSMRCDTCGEFIYKGKKYNARKEKVKGEDYLGIIILRFYIVCPRCAAEITFKTDPKNHDYTCEHGATRNYEPWRDDEGKTELMKAGEEEEEEDDPLQDLELRTKESKREMEVMDALDEIRTRNARIERGAGEIATAKFEQIEAAHEAKLKALREAEEAEDMATAASVFGVFEGEGIRRVEDWKLEAPMDIQAVKSFGLITDDSKKRPAVDAESSIPKKLGVQAMVRKKTQPAKQPEEAAKAVVKQASSSIGLLAAYDSGSDTSQ